jgi:hypothetical protein
VHRRCCRDASRVATPVLPSAAWPGRTPPTPAEDPGLAGPFTRGAADSGVTSVSDGVPARSSTRWPSSPVVTRLWVWPPPPRRRADYGRDVTAADNNFRRRPLVGEQKGDRIVLNGDRDRGLSRLRLARPVAHSRPTPELRGRDLVVASGGHAPDRRGNVGFQQRGAGAGPCRNRVPAVRCADRTADLTWAHRGATLLLRRGAAGCSHRSSPARRAAGRSRAARTERSRSLAEGEESARSRSPGLNRPSPAGPWSCPAPR